MKLTGTWVGEYTYGPDYNNTGVAGSSVPFAMSLTESSPQRVAGYVRDTQSRGEKSSGKKSAAKRPAAKKPGAKKSAAKKSGNGRQAGRPERGRIRGTRTGQTVQFTKVMTVGYVFDEDGNQTEMREYLEQTWEITLPDKLPPHRIRYTGKLDADSESIEGVWQILPWLRTENGEWLGGDKGTWKARRTSDQPSEV